MGALLRIGGFDLEIRKLRSAEGGLQALLLPCARGRFRLLVDSEPRGGWHSVEPALRDELARHRTRFRIAHELAHSFFYERVAEGPRRRVADSEQQERFCDEFARALLVPPEVPARLAASPEDIVHVHRVYDVSVEVAARVFARAWPTTAIWVVLADDSGEPNRVQWQADVTYAVDRRPGWFRRIVAAAVSAGHAASEVIWTGQGRGVANALHLPERRQVLVVATAPAPVA
jgi:hypothetical protein